MEKYSVAAIVRKYTAENSILSPEKRCFRWFTGPQRAEKLIKKKRLPIVYNRANFLAFRTSTGMYREHRKKQNSPSTRKSMNPMILCFFDRLGRHGSLFALVNHPSGSSPVSVWEFESPLLPFLPVKFDHLSPNLPPSPCVKLLAPESRLDIEVDFSLLLWTKSWSPPDMTISLSFTLHQCYMYSLDYCFVSLF